MGSGRRQNVDVWGRLGVLHKMLVSPYLAIPELLGFGRCAAAPNDAVGVLLKGVPLVIVAAVKMAVDIVFIRPGLPRRGNSPLQQCKPGANRWIFSEPLSQLVQVDWTCVELRERRIVSVIECLLCRAFSGFMEWRLDRPHHSRAGKVMQIENWLQI